MNVRSSRLLRWTGYVAVAVAFAIACAFLSHWQFSRNAERSAQLALIDANYDAAPVPLAELVPEPGAFDDAERWHPVTMTGRYLLDEQLLVRNRPHGGTAAYEILVPFRSTDGRILLVDRGWVPPGEEQAEPDEIPAAPSGEVTVVARLVPGEELPSSGRSAPEGQVPTINLPLIDTMIGGGLDTGAYGQLVSEDPAPPSVPTPLEDPSDDPGPYLSYAVQWILFAIMGFTFIGYVIRTEIRQRREEAADAAAQPTANPGSAEDVAGTEETVPSTRDTATPPRRRRRTRRDRDAADEDAILDDVMR